MSTCVYCGRKVTEEHPVSFGTDVKKAVACSAACAEKTTAFTTLFKKRKPVFIAGICLSMAILIASTIILGARSTILGAVLMGLSLVLMGATVFFFPFATPQTYEMFSLKTALRITKILGIVVAVLGIVFAVPTIIFG
jgi:hypothetical protein